MAKMELLIPPPKKKTKKQINMPYTSAETSTDKFMENDSTNFHIHPSLFFLLYTLQLGYQCV